MSTSSRLRLFPAASLCAGRIDGTLTCVIMSGQTRFNVRGSWRATRE